ncbi:hypothetical protein T11_12791 [Trichinella zimbabwensis]|uniref:Uncharacterized protein n=2 Tax=Trichinella TaxID=6333 RepID=A0A0V1GYS6_9BILA|nr:hypothetical protein T11_12791 [Trichinella zimbabwensis]
MNRSNVPKENRVTVWTPFLENVIQQFHDKFLQHRNNAMRLSALIPRFLDQYDLSPLKSLMATYLRYIEDQSEVLKCEVACWKRKRENVLLEDCPANAFDALALYPEDYYLNVSLLL